MQIDSIHLKNVKSHRELELNFSPGINVLSGPNGVGKSTIFEAIGYALFGVEAQSFVGNIERFISIGAKKGEIAVIFQVEAGRFRVSRTVGTPAKWLLAREAGGAFEVEEHKDARETEARLKELLGLAGGRSLAEQFELVIGPFQNEFLGPFVEKRPTTRRNRFDEILGIDSWRKTFKDTNNLLKAIKNKVDVLEGAIGPLRDQVAALPEKRETHRAVLQQQAETRQEFKHKQKGLQELTDRLKEFDRREMTVKDLTVQIDKLKERIANGREKISAQDALIAEAEKSQRVVADNLDGKQAFEAAEKSLGALREKARVQRRLEQELAALEKRASTLDASREAEEKSIQQAGTELDAEQKRLADERQTLAIDDAVRQRASRLPDLQEQVRALRAQLGQLEGRRSGLEEGSEKLAEGICPFFQEPCLNIAQKPPGDVFSAKFAELGAERQRLEEELAQREGEETAAAEASEQLRSVALQLKGLDEQMMHLERRRQEIEKRQTRMAEAQDGRAEVQRQLEAKTKQLAAYSTLTNEIEQAEAEQKRHQAARDLYVAHQAQGAKLPGLQAEKEKFETLLETLLEEKKGKEADLKSESQAYEAELHRQLREEKDALGREVGALEQKLAGLKVEQERLAGEIDRLKAIAREIADKQAQVKTYGEKEALVKFLRNRVFNKVSASLSERFREEISQRANRIYRIIAEADEELAWGEDYRIVLRDMVDGDLRERADDQLSGGQMMSAVVALRLALLQTIGARIAFFDEPTSNLDVVRRENLAHAFRAIDVGKEEVTEHWYDQLFLVSHDVAFTEVTDQMIELGE